MWWKFLRQYCVTSYYGEILLHHKIGYINFLALFKAVFWGIPVLINDNELSQPSSDMCIYAITKPYEILMLQRTPQFAHFKTAIWFISTCSSLQTSSNLDKQCVYIVTSSWWWKCWTAPVDQRHISVTIRNNAQVNLTSFGLFNGLLCMN